MKTTKPPKIPAGCNSTPLPPPPYLCDLPFVVNGQVFVPIVLNEHIDGLETTRRHSLIYLKVPLGPYLATSEHICSKLFLLFSRARRRRRRACCRWRSPDKQVKPFEFIQSNFMNQPRSMSQNRCLEKQKKNTTAI